jgi:hypothetical protein
MPDVSGSAAALRYLAGAPLGTRVVVRSRLAAADAASASGATHTDAVGDLISRTDTGCTIDTKRGPVQILFSSVTLAKAVPPPPAPRPPRR